MLGLLMAATVFLSPMGGGDVNYRPLRVFDDAAWVWTAEKREAKFFRFRNDFEADGSPLVLHVSADERFVLLLDGEELSRGPARGMGSHWFCQKVTAGVFVWRGRERPLAEGPNEIRFEDVDK